MKARVAGATASTRLALTPRPPAARFGLPGEAMRVSLGENGQACSDRRAQRHPFGLVRVFSDVRSASGPPISWAEGAGAALCDEMRPGEDGLAGRAKENAG